MARNPHAHPNPDLHRSVTERARSGAAGPHRDRRTRRARTRAAAKAAALRDG